MSVLESLLSTLPYPMLMAERMRNLRSAHQHSCGADDGHRSRRRRMDRNQLPYGSALARCVRDARAAGVRRAPDRNHAGRPRAQRSSSSRPNHGSQSAPSLRSSNSARRCEFPPLPSTTARPRCSARNTSNAGSSSMAAATIGRSGRPGAPFRLSRDARVAAASRTPPWCASARRCRHRIADWASVDDGRRTRRCRSRASRFST